MEPVFQVRCQPRLEEAAPDLAVARRISHDVREAVLVDEALELLHADRDRLLDVNRQVVESIVETLWLEDRVDEGDRPPLAADRAGAEADERAIGLLLERREVRDGTDVLLPPRRAQHAQEVLAEPLRVLELLDAPRAQLAREHEHPSRHQPRREVIALRMKDQRRVRDLGEDVLHLVHVAGATDLRPIRETKDEVPEAEIVAQEVADVSEDVRRALVGERDVELVGPGRGTGLGGLEQDRQVGHREAPRPGHQLEARLRIDLTAARKPNVRDHREQVVAVVLERADRLLEVDRQEDLGTRAHPHALVQVIDALGHQRTRLSDQLEIEQREEHRVVADRVLDHHHHPHAGGRVVVEVPAVLDQLDRRDQHARISGPEKDGVEPGRAGAEVRQLSVCEGEEHQGERRELRLHGGGEAERVTVGEVHHRDDQIEPPLPQQLDRHDGVVGADDGR